MQCPWSLAAISLLYQASQSLLQIWPLPQSQPSESLVSWWMLRLKKWGRQGRSEGKDAFPKSPHQAYTSENALPWHHFLSSHYDITSFKCAWRLKPCAKMSIDNQQTAISFSNTWKHVTPKWKLELVKSNLYTQYIILPTKLSKFITELIRIKNRRQTPLKITFCNVCVIVPFSNVLSTFKSINAVLNRFIMVLFLCPIKKLYNTWCI